MKTIQYREKKLINTDPQRRCYDGVHAASEVVWGDWIRLETWEEETIQKRLEFWVGLNDYAVSERGESARNEYRIV